MLSKCWFELKSISVIVCVNQLLREQEIRKLPDNNR